MKTFYHVKHACNHSVFWENGIVGLIASVFPCPFCGGESGNPVIADVLCIVYDDPVGEVVRELTADGYLPASAERKDDEAVIIKHQTGDICCNKTRVS